MSLALEMAKFRDEAALVKQRLQLSLCAIDAILNSTAMPQLLRGVLVLGNFVNSSSTSLGGAVGVSLESLAKLAHTRCIDQPRSRPNCQGIRQDNALHFLLRQLQQGSPGLVDALAKDLDCCLKVEDIEVDVLAVNVQSLQSLVVKVQDSETVKEAVPAFSPARLNLFCEMAEPETAYLSKSLAELRSATAALQHYFAEPENTRLQEMFRNLAELRRAMPNSRVQKASPFPPFPKPCHLRPVTGEGPGPKELKRASSLPAKPQGSGSMARTRSCPAQYFSGWPISEEQRAHEADEAVLLEDSEDRKSVV